MKFKFIFILITFLAFVLRFWMLGQNPASLDWDEASLGYNAYSILKTGKDEYGKFLPLSIRSFGDYKPPLYTYLSTIPIAIFGLNEFSTRFISAFLGTLAVITGYFLFRELFSGYPYRLSLIFYLLFSISPWHIQFSRVAFEANVALFFFIFGTLFFLKAKRRPYYYFFSFISYALSLYSYHSPRLIVPVFLTGLFIFEKNFIRKNLKIFSAGFLLFILLVIPIGLEIKSSGARFGSVTIINNDEKLGSSISQQNKDKEEGDFFGSLMHNRRIVFLREIVGGYLDHFNFDFLFLTGDSAGRHHSYGMGMLYVFELPFILIGILYLLQNKSYGKYIVFLWFISAPLASSVTKATPHAVRALLYLPTYQIFSAFGIYYALKRLDNSYNLYKKIIIVITVLLLLINSGYYLHMYYIHTPKIYASWWQFGYKEAFREIRNREDLYSKIIFTYEYDQPYIYYLFFNRIDPSWYQKNWGGPDVLRDFRSFGKYDFRKINWNEDSYLSNVLIIGTPKEIPADASGVISNINYPDGAVAFRIVGR